MEGIHVTDPYKRINFAVPAKMFTEAPKPSAIASARRFLRVFRMIAILHGKGFQRLRVFPFFSPTGFAIRVALYPARFTAEDGVKIDDLLQPVAEEHRLIAWHNSSAEANYFGWSDVEKHSAEQLALTFINRLPQIARASYGLDYAYAGWFATLLAHCEYGYFPYLFSDSEDDIGVLRMTPTSDLKRTSSQRWFPLPPSPGCGHQMDPGPNRLGEESSK